VAAFGNEEIARLEIAVNDALGVGSIESVGDFYANIEKLLSPKPVASEKVAP
jgi:hypothetical protein